MCNKVQCKEIGLNNNKLKEIFKGGNDSLLRFLVNERGFDTTYIDLSSGNIKMYLIRYTEGDNEQENFYLSYTLNGIFKVKFLGQMKKIINNKNIYFNGVKVNLD